MFKISWSLITNTIFFWNFWSAHLQNFLNTSFWRHISKTKLFTDTYLCSASLTSPKDALSEKNVLVLIFLIDMSSGCLFLYIFILINTSGRCLQNVFQLSFENVLKTFFKAQFYWDICIIKQISTPILSVFFSFIASSVIYFYYITDVITIDCIIESTQYIP